MLTGVGPLRPLVAHALCVLALVGSLGLAYANSFDAEFIFDSTQT